MKRFPQHAACRGYETGEGDMMLDQLTEDQLRAEMDKWAQHVATAAGWASAYMAAKECLRIEREAKRRGLCIENPHPIMINGMRKE